MTAASAAVSTTAPLPVTSEQFEDDSPVVVVDLTPLRGSLHGDGFGCDGHTLTLSPDAADALGASLTAKAAAIRQGLPLDITYTDGDES
ncbi:hypothetical protein [Curtobacterium sp. MCSS17_015]|uniref:hypothetical protein n=1 Tax=Curtobacterium sp. MCSS17_015 TaxID=2175666 RepID=UPI000DA74AC0|nr:hypothetical protein [Curtobacterium sp. MCSS17_015]WIB25406.1 hypothetical protein DEJ18_10085 [Curtobacterium sp. MCSS17_015]